MDWIDMQQSSHPANEGEVGFPVPIALVPSSCPAYHE